MDRIRKWRGAGILLAAGPVMAVCNAAPSNPEQSDRAVLAAVVGSGARPVAVTGSAVHFFTTAIVHSQEPAANGMVQRSSEIIRLTGDLSGYILYHPVSTFDHANGTLVNTGTQIFSGTVLGSEPVILHDDAFRFDVNLATGATTGTVHLGRSSDAPHEGAWYECNLVVTGTGMTPEGDALADYEGECTRFGRPE